MNNSRRVSWPVEVHPQLPRAPFHWVHDRMMADLISLHGPQAQGALYASSATGFRVGGPNGFWERQNLEDIFSCKRTNGSPRNTENW